MPSFSEKILITSTIEYYNNNAEQYCNNTFDVDMSGIYEKFISHLSPKSLILDAGCGSGRDTVHFLKSGYQVDAFDASSAMVEISQKNTGIDVKLMQFSDFYAEGKYDAIWACASLLHLSYGELINTLFKFENALKENGVIYMSFRYGNIARSDGGRYFYDMDEESAKSLITTIGGLTIVEIWTGEGEGKYHGLGKWLNISAIKRAKTS